jgi:hypothetical protein
LAKDSPARRRRSATPSQQTAARNRPVRVTALFTR